MSKIMPTAEAGGPHLMNSGEAEGPGYAMAGDGNDDDSIPDTNPLTDEQHEAIKQKAVELIQARENVYANLASVVEGKLTQRMGTRKSKENQWLESLRIYLGSLSSYNIVTGDYPFGTKNENALTHRPEFNFIRQKCNIAIAQTVAHQFAAGDKNWDINPPEVIDLDDEDMQQMQQITQQAQMSPEDVIRMKADLMEREIAYHLDGTRYGPETRKALMDRVVLGSGVMKWPLNAGRLKKIYKKSKTSDGKSIRVPDFTLETVPLVYRVNPWYFFPDDSVTDIAKAEDSIEAHPMSKQELIDLLKHPGYIKDQIEPCLKEEPRQYTNSPFNDPAYLTQGVNLLKNKYLVLEYHGPVKKTDLELLGIDHGDDSPIDQVYAEVWIVNSRCIRLQIETLEGCNRVPYSCCVWEPDPATIFGFGIPMLARDQQKVVNETYKMILDNAGVSAGPQVVVDTTIISPADGDMACTPFKVWYTKEYGADISKAINFFTPTNSFDQLSSLIQMARGFADEESSINLYMGNSGTPAGASDNATNTALLNENAMTPLFFKSEEWDDNMTLPLITAMYDWEMQYNPKDEIKGSYQIDVRTVTAYLRDVMDNRTLSELSQEISQQSPIGEWVNLDELMQIRLSRSKLPSTTLIKSPAQVAQERQQKSQQPQQQDPNVLKAQAMMQANQIDAQKLQLAQQQMQLDQQKAQSETASKLQQTQITNDANIRSHQLDIQKANVQLEGIRTQAGLNAHSTNTQAAVTLQNNLNDNATKKQLGGLAHAQHVQSLQQQQAAIESQEKQATEANEIKLRTVRVNAAARDKNRPNRNLTKHNAK